MTRRTRVVDCVPDLVLGSEDDAAVQHGYAQDPSSLSHSQRELDRPVI